MDLMKQQTSRDYLYHDLDEPTPPHGSKYFRRYKKELKRKARRRLDRQVEKILKKDIDN